MSTSAATGNLMGVAAFAQLGGAGVNAVGTIINVPKENEVKRLNAASEIVGGINIPPYK